MQLNPDDSNYLKVVDGIISPMPTYFDEIGSIQYPDSIYQFSHSKPIMVVNSKYTNIDYYLNSIFKNILYHYSWTIKFPIILNGRLLKEQEKAILTDYKTYQYNYISSHEAQQKYPYCGCPFGLFIAKG